MFSNLTRTIPFVAALALAAVFSTPASAAHEEAIATVNGVAVPKSRFDLLLSSQTSQAQEDTPAFREELREIMITREVLVQEAGGRCADRQGNPLRIDAGSMIAATEPVFDHICRIVRWDE